MTAHDTRADALASATGTPARAADDIIDVSDVVVEFGDLRAVDGVDLRIPRGSIYALLGPNGAGKTTLIRVLATLLKPVSGSVRVAGIDVVAEPQRARAHIGLAGQFSAVDPYQTGRENVEMVGRLYGLPAAESASRTAEVLQRIGLATAGDRRVDTYSGGMRRRLDLAASLVGRPEVLFLDEPTTGIDPLSRQDVWELVNDLVDDGTTILLTTQYLEEADRLADLIGVIDHGRIISEGTADELKDTLGAATIEVGIDPEIRERTEALLAEVGGHEVVWDGERNRLRLAAPEGPRTLMDVSRVLDDAGITPTEFEIRRPTLDDVFLSLTGASVEDDTPADEPRGRRARKAAR